MQLKVELDAFRFCDSQSRHTRNLRNYSTKSHH